MAVQKILCRQVCSFVYWRKHNRKHMADLSNLPKIVGATKVISARVPVDIHTAFQSVCKQYGMTNSQFIREALTRVTNKDVATYGSGGIAEVGEVSLPDSSEEVFKVLGSLGGGALAGILVYKAVFGVLKAKSGMEEDEMEAISGVLAVIGGIAAGFGLYKLFSD